MKAEKNNRGRISHEAGFSLLELLITMTVIVIVTAIAVPSFTRMYRAYQLDDVASQVAGVIKITRFEAVRRNMQVNCKITQSGSNPATTTIWTDSNGNGTVDSTEKQILLSSVANMVSASTPPGTTALATAIGTSTLTAVSLSSGSITFDARGAVTPAAVYVLYVGNAAIPDYGYRAVILLPSGSVQVWTASAAGDWHLLG